MNPEKMSELLAERYRLHAQFGQSSYTTSMPTVASMSSFDAAWRSLERFDEAHPEVAAEYNRLLMESWRTHTDFDVAIGIDSGAAGGD